MPSHRLVCHRQGRGCTGIISGGQEEAAREDNARGGEGEDSGESRLGGRRSADCFLPQLYSLVWIGQHAAAVERWEEQGKGVAGHRSGQEVRLTGPKGKTETLTAAPPLLPFCLSPDARVCEKVACIGVHLSSSQLASAKERVWVWNPWRKVSRSSGMSCLAIQEQRGLTSSQGLLLPATLLGGWTSWLQCCC